MAALLKDMVDRAVVHDLGARFGAAAPGFDVAGFESDLAAQLPDLELKPRIEAIARRIAAGLDDDYRTALATVVAVALAEPAIGGFSAWPLCTFVELFGVEDPEVSLPAMEHLTKRASCEFAVRPFLIRHWDAAYTQLEAFAGHDDETVRRLTSEGMRPRLPWGMRVPRLIDDPEPGLTLLGRLRYDPSESVRRSVANHLNDIAKDHPDLVVHTLGAWLHARRPVDRKMASHALRTLVKRGDPAALEVLGYTTDAAVTVPGFSVVPGVVRMGDQIELEATIKSCATDAQHLVVDFVIHHVTASGGTSPKVFKWSTLDLRPGEEATLRKRRRIEHASTRTYHRGRHLVELQVAGSVVAASSFDVHL
jgi:3-methyladenine DNA glycosylase AlkC